MISSHLDVDISAGLGTLVALSNGQIDVSLQSNSVGVNILTSGGCACPFPLSVYTETGIDLSGGSAVIMHNLNSSNVIWQISDETTGESIVTTGTQTSVNDLTITASGVTNLCKVMVVGVAA